MKGIMFKPNMIKAIREGRKTQTRRLNYLAGINEYPNQWELMPGHDHDSLVWLFRNTEISDIITAKPRYGYGRTIYIKEVWAICSFSAKNPTTSPLTLKVDDESKGMLMPMNIQDIPPIVQEKATGTLPTKPEPEPPPAREPRKPVIVNPEMADQILEGYSDLDEARDALREFADRDIVGYTSRGQEVTPDMLRQAIEIKSSEQPPC